MNGELRHDVCHASDAETAANRIEKVGITGQYKDQYECQTGRSCTKGVFEPPTSIETVAAHSLFFRREQDSSQEAKPSTPPKSEKAATTKTTNHVPDVIVELL